MHLLHYIPTWDKISAATILTATTIATWATITDQQPHHGTTIALSVVIAALTLLNLVNAARIGMLHTSTAYQLGTIILDATLDYDDDTHPEDRNDYH